MEELWIGGKALILLLIYSIIVSIMVYVYCFNSELTLIPPREATYEIIKNAMSISLFIGLVIGADSLSGERDRGTLESLLLTSTDRREIVTGKFLAALTQWPAAFIIILPFINILSQVGEIFTPAVVWGGITGTLLVVGFTGLGMLVSFWSASNKISYFFSLGIYALFLVPAQLPGRAENIEEGLFFQWINPLASVNHLLSEHLVNYRPVLENWLWLLAPAVFTLFVMLVLFLYAAPGLRLAPGRKRGRLAKYSRTAISLLIAGSVIFSLAVSPALASESRQQDYDDLQLSVDTTVMEVKTGDTLEYSTQVTNNGAAETPPLILAMNIVNVDPEGEVVDPEDWSPERTQYIASLESGASAKNTWVISPILDGNYMVYMALIPEPVEEGKTSEPIVTSGIHLTVMPFNRLHPRDVLPYTIGVPLFLGLLLLIVYSRRRQQIDNVGA
jgi:ABC-2 type transport system permease protein